MTGLFQIFDRYRTLSGRKSAQKKVANGQGGGRDPSCISFAYHMAIAALRVSNKFMVQFQDESTQRRATLDGVHDPTAQGEASREPRRSSIDNSEVMLAKALANAKDPQLLVEQKSQPARSSLDSRPKPRLSFYFKEDTPANDTPAVPPVAPAKEPLKEPPRNSFSVLLQRKNPDPTIIPARSSVEGRTPWKEDKEKKTRDFRGMFKGSFLRKESKVNSQESPGSSFNLRDDEQLKGFSELPVEEKEGLELNVDLSGLDVLVGDERAKPYNRYDETPRGWIESREGLTPRLTVELKEGPQLTRKDDQRVSINELPALSRLQDPGHYIDHSGLASAPIDFRESLKAIESRELRKEKLREMARRSVDGKDPPRLSSDAKTASRLSADGRLNLRQTSLTPRFPTDGKDTHHGDAGHYVDVRTANYSLETSANVSPRRDNSRIASPRGDCDWENDLDGSRWRASSVVARLMGLEDLPNFDVVPPQPTGMSPSRDCKSPQRGYYYIQPEESPHPDSDDIYSLVCQPSELLTPKRKETSDHTNSRPLSPLPTRMSTLPFTPPKLHLDYSISHKELENGVQPTLASPKLQPMSPPKHHMMEGMPQALKHPVEQTSPCEGLYGDMDERLRQLGLRNTIQERKTLKQILEAMHLKGLLHPPRMDNEGKPNYPGQDQTVAKSLFQGRKERSSGRPITSLRADLFDLDYKDMPKFRPAQKTKGLGEGVQGYEGIQSSLSGRSFNGEASIVVMKPLNVKPASKLVPVKPSPNLPHGKEMESMPARPSSVPRKLAATSTTRGTVEKDSSISTTSGTSTKIRIGSNSIKPRPRSRSVDPQPTRNRVEELPATAMQRRERIAACTAKVASEGGEAHPRDVSPKPTRSVSPPVAKRLGAGKETTSVKIGASTRSAFGSSITRPGEGKSRGKLMKDREEIKLTTQVTRRTQSSRELLNEKLIPGEQEASKKLSRSRSDSKLVAKCIEKTVTPEPWSKSQGKGPAEVAVLQSKRRTGRTSRDTIERPRLSLPVESEPSSSIDMSKEKFHLQDQSGQWESTADLYSENIDSKADRSQNVTPFIITSPPFSLPENQRRKVVTIAAEKLMDGFHDPRERQRSKSKVNVSHTESEVDYKVYRRDEGASTGKIAGSSISELLLDDFRSAAGEDIRQSSDVSTPQGMSMKKLQHVENADSRRLAERAEQPSPVSVLDNVHFQEEVCTPSPGTEKTLSLQGAGNAELEMQRNSRGASNSEFPDLSAPLSQIIGETGDPINNVLYTVGQSLDLDDKDSYLNKPTLEIQVPYICDISTPPPTTPSPPPSTSLPSSFNTKEDENAYMRHIMVVSGITEEVSTPSEWPASGQIIDVDFYDQTEEHLELQASARKQNVYLSGEERTEYQREALDRRLLFDCVNNILERKLHPYLKPQPWGSLLLRKKPTGLKLVQEVWDELQEIRARALDDDSLYTILQKDFARRSEKWVDFSVEIGEIGIELEEIIFEETMEAAVQQLMDDCTNKRLSPKSLTRDVFAY